MSRQIGLRDVVVAKITADDGKAITYDAPFEISKAIQAKLTPKITSDEIYSDDRLEEVLNTFNSIDVELEVGDLSMEARAYLQGASISSGVLVESSDDVAPEVAFGFRSKKSNGEFRYIWLFKGKFELATDAYETVADKVKVQSNTLKATFSSRIHDKLFRIMCDSDKTTTTLSMEKVNPLVDPATDKDALIAGWFNGVPTVTITPGTGGAKPTITVTPATKAA